MSLKATICFGLGLLVSSIGHGAEQQNATNTTQTVRVMSYNIRHARGQDDKVDVARIAEVIKKEKADIVGLQEVDKGVVRSGRVDLPAELAKLTGMHVFFEKNIPYQGGEYGNAILSRYPILQQTNSYYKMIRAGEQRALQQVVVDVKGRKLLFMNTHIDYRPDDTERLMNVVEMKEALKRYPGLPSILTGDFNDYPNGRTHKSVKEAFADAWEAVGTGDGFTYPSDKPRSRIDYIFYSQPETLKPIKAWVVDTQASDHSPLVADFVLR